MASKFRRFRTTRHRYQKVGHSTKGHGAPTKGGTGCATTRRNEDTITEHLLAAAGFRMRATIYSHRYRLRIDGAILPSLSSSVEAAPPRRPAGLRERAVAGQGYRRRLLGPRSSFAMSTLRSRRALSSRGRIHAPRYTFVP
jgi:hypothetical protein